MAAATDFASVQSALAAARADRRTAEAAARQADQLLRSLRRARAADAAAIAAASQQAAAARQTASSAAAVEAAALAAFNDLADPRRAASELGDSLPFVLMPVRLETRFIRAGGDAQRWQLWVRIYPDDCWIDTFEPQLSSGELANAKTYWQDMWRAGGVEADQRAAWRNLVAAQGSGRAGYILDSYQPVNVAAQPVKAQATDEVLVIPTQTAPAAADAAAVSAYWQAVWRADGDAAALQAAQAALQAAVGAANAAALIAAYQPYNLSDTPAAPLQKSDVAVTTAFVIFPPDPPTKAGSWTQAPQVDLFPERFVVLGYNAGAVTLQAIGSPVRLPLYVGPDPSVDLNANPDAAIHPAGGDLFVPDPLKWLIDFPSAVAAGMGITIDLTAEQARAGFDRLLVVGLVLGERDGNAKVSMETLLRHHANGRSGLALVSQGTPAHNTTGTGTGYTRVDDPNQSFDDRKNAPLFTTTDDATRKRDGQWLGELLGVDPAIFVAVHGSGGADQMQARAMQRAMWPATIGYWMDKLLAPAFSDDTVANTRWFVSEFVSGRGPAPAIRVRHQPYGILLTTAFSRMRWLDSERALGARGAFLARLLAMLRLVAADWTAMSANASCVGKPGDAHQILLDIVGLHPSSVEYYSRTAESLEELFNVANMWGLGPDFFNALVALALQAAASSLLNRLGYTGTQLPDILNHYFFKQADQITTVIDDRPLSETDPIRAYASGNRNYIRWLIDAADTSLDALNAEQGFTGNATPQALLYLYLRHALMLGYYDTSYALHKSAGFLTPAQLAAMKPEPAFIHVAAGAAASESRFAALYKTEPLITGSPTLRVSDYITTHLAFLPQSAGLRDQLDALAILANAATAQLERAFSEHIDLCSYRYDAWLLGLVNLQLQGMRYGPVVLGTGHTGRTVQRTGLYLGAYAWLEDLRPSGVMLAPVQVPANVAAAFQGATPIVQDPRNGGYIHAPSMTHARTAAVLRSGYLANATPGNPQTMSVNLSSDRVRLALSLLEGVRGGQSIGALLGYRFERGLHDDNGLAEVDKLIYPLRKAFPLVADNLAPTQTPPNVPIEAIEARNVMDGRKLVEQVRTSGVTTYPFGVTTLPAATAAEAAALNAEANGLLDLYGAIADLALAEGVHQAVQGNFERIGATLNAYTSGNFPPDPQVVQTGPTGIGLTHRVALHLTSGLAPAAGATPRAQAEPALDAWLSTMLPPLDQIGCVVTWTDQAGAAQSFAVTLQDLGLRPLDVLALAKPDAVQTMTELDDRTTGAVLAGAAPRPDLPLQISYMTAPAGKISIFAAMALVRVLKTLVSGARPLQASDAMLQNAATSNQNSSSVFMDRTRVATPKTALDTLSADIATYLAPLSALLTNPAANAAAILAGIDAFLDGAVPLLERAARFNVPQSGWGFAFAWRRRVLADLLAQVRDLVTRWTARLADFDTRIAAYDALAATTSDADRFKALRAAEADVTAQFGPLPPSPTALRTQLNAERTSFVARRDQFAAVLAMGGTTFKPFLDAVTALLPVTQWDTQPFDVSGYANRAVLFATDLAKNLSGHRTAIDQRRQAARAALDAHDAAGTPAAEVSALQTGAKALMGDDFVTIPEFGLSAQQGDDWSNAVAASTGGALLSYLTNTLNIDHPVDEWLTGVARVRPMMRAWESATVLASALGQLEPALLPVQFPFEATAPWLALQFPDSYNLASDRLLYTACYATPFDKTKRQCGLLLDQWNEVIPAANRDTGITFNFARPDNEAPQTILVVTPATASGRWQWDDLVAALSETLDLAKKRAVEPTQLDNTPYAPLLPATVMAVTLYAISIATNLGIANGALQHLEAARNV
jgi:hypothetical protein